VQQGAIGPAAGRRTLESTVAHYDRGSNLDLGQGSPSGTSSHQAWSDVSESQAQWRIKTAEDVANILVGGLLLRCAGGRGVDSRVRRSWALLRGWNYACNPSDIATNRTSSVISFGLRTSSKLLLLHSLRSKFPCFPPCGMGLGF